MIGAARAAQAAEKERWRAVSTALGGGGGSLAPGPQPEHFGDASSGDARPPTLVPRPPLRLFS